MIPDVQGHRNKITVPNSGKNAAAARYLQDRCDTTRVQIFSPANQNLHKQHFYYATGNCYYDVPTSTIMLVGRSCKYRAAAAFSPELGTVILFRCPCTCTKFSTAVSSQNGNLKRF